MSEIFSQAEAADTYARLSGPIPADIRKGLSAAASAGRKKVTVMTEALALAGGPGRLSVSEYFYYRLWDNSAPLADKLRFVGKRVQAPMHKACNDASWFAITEDKLLFQAAAVGAGLPVPKLHAISHSTRRLGSTRCVATPREIEDLLLDALPYPCFAKPIGGRYSLGAVGLSRLGQPGMMILTNGKSVAIPEVVDHLHQAGGYVIQEHLRCDPTLREMYGNRLWSVRIIVLLGPKGPQPLCAACKIPASGAMADNFWRPGNMLGAVDIDTGRLVRAVRGAGCDMEVDFDHPETGRPIVGTNIPLWGDVLRLVSEASALIPGVRTQSWDVALTDKGPVLLEVNFGGDLNLVQLAHGRGLLDRSYVTHLRARGYAEKKFVRWAPQLVESAA